MRGGYLRLPRRSRGVVLGVTALVLNPIFLLILAWAMQPATVTHTAAVSRGEAQFMPRAEPNRLDPQTAGPTAAPAPTAQAGITRASLASPRRKPSPTPPPLTCTGPPLTSQSQVRANTSYCGGHATTRIVLANGDTWTSGEVSGASSGRQQGALQCGNPCTLINMNVHDNPHAFAGVYAPWTGSGPMLVSGGRVTGSGSLGIGGSGVSRLTVSGVEIDHNGVSASCGTEGGGFKGANHASRFTGNYVHDNHCFGVWYDMNSAKNEIDHNRVDNNAYGGIFVEISQDAFIHDNEASGNGAGACTWLWGAGIGVADSFNVSVYSNTLTNNCNGVGAVQQNRPQDTPPAHLLLNLSVTGNTIRGSGKTGATQDNGANLAARNLVFARNSFSAGAVFCGLTC
jgi:parallel beta-helix repeat protein